MDSGFYAACAGLRAKTQALEIVANNVANLHSSGYRAHQATFQSFLAGNSRAAANPLNQAVNDFGVLAGTRLDPSAGSMERTGNSWDLAIEGDGYFAAQSREGTLYTRNGSFHVSSTGQLLSSEGDPVLGEQGPIVVPSGTASVGSDGAISVGDALAGKIRVVRFAPDASLRSVGSSYYTTESSPVPAPGSGVRQGMLESSNVSPMAAVVSLITVQRQAEMLQRALTTFHSEFNHIASTELPRV